MSVACNLIPLGDRLDSDSTVDFLDKDAVGLNGLCSLSWCLHKYYHVLNVIARLSLCYNLVNCLAVICLYECFIYLRDSSSEPTAPGPSCYIDCNLYSSLLIIITPLVHFHNVTSQDFQIFEIQRDQKLLLFCFKTQNHAWHS